MPKVLLLVLTTVLLLAISLTTVICNITIWPALRVGCKCRVFFFSCFFLVYLQTTCNLLGFGSSTVSQQHQLGFVVTWYWQLQYGCSGLATVVWAVFLRPCTVGNLYSTGYRYDNIWASYSILLNAYAYFIFYTTIILI